MMSGVEAAYKVLKKKGRLEPNEAGAIYMDYVARNSGVSRDALGEQDPYFRMLNDEGELPNCRNQARASPGWSR